MTVRDAMLSGAARLNNAGVPDPDWDAGVLLSHALSLPRMALRLYAGDEIEPEKARAYEALLTRRAMRVPLQYVTGSQCFYGLDFRVDERVLIPRPETELLCEQALLWLKNRPSPSVLDLCTGSGALAVTIAALCPGAAVTAADLSENALEVARENARQNAAAVRFVRGDLFAPIGRERFDLIVSNPPYIETADCETLQEEVLREPRIALDGGEDGLLFYRRIAAEATEHLLPGGRLLMEIGSAQGEAVCRLLTDAGLTGARVLPDLNGLDRMALADNAI